MISREDKKNRGKRDMGERERGRRRGWGERKENGGKLELRNQGQMTQTSQK